MYTDAEIRDQILVALRRISRAIDLHSRQLVQSCGLTGPQVLLLKQLYAGGPVAVSELAERVSLSQATVTDILNRLERRGLINRARSIHDKRRVLVSVAEAGERLLESSPPLLQEQFAEELGKLQDWEKTQLLSSLQRIAAMMNAKQLDASPLISTGAVSAAPEAIETVTDTAADATAGVDAPGRPGVAAQAPGNAGPGTRSAKQGKV